MLALNNLSIRIGGRLLIEDASVQLPKCGRVGLIGRNGTGKSTLLKAILGEVAVESGEIKHRSSAQDRNRGARSASGAQTPLAHVLAANTERTALGRTRDDGGRQSGRRYP